MPTAGSVVLQARGLRVERPGDDGLSVVLRGIDLDIAEGTLTDLSGRSGAGKTTLLLALARLLPGAEGALSLAGVPAEQIEPRVWRMRVAYLPQSASLVPGSVGDNLLLPWRLALRRAASPPGAAVLREALDRVHLRGVALDRDASRLSVGQAARVALLRTLLTSPECLLLDEPDANLDDESAAQVARMTQEYLGSGGAVVRVRHARVDADADVRLLLLGGQLEAVAGHV